MRLFFFIFGSVFLMISDEFIVQGPTGPLFIRLGSSVILPCYVDEPLPMKRLKVEWRRTDSNILVHLFIYGDSRPEEQHQDYQDRAHFFKEYIKDGIFSLRLDDLRAEDKGIYRCMVYSKQDTGETVIQIKDVEHLTVSGSNHPVSAYLGEDVTMNCSVDSHITPEEVSWRKTDENEEILVLLFQSNTIQPDSSDERYRDRVEFFTDEIPKGNFSVRLKSVRSEDKGVYMCHVKNGRLSANTTVIIERLEHLMVSGPNRSISSLNVGEDVTLNCSVENYIPSEEISWKKKDKDGDILVLVFEKYKSLPAVEQYRDRIEFSTDEISKGNFSVRLKSVRTEDKGVYVCQVKNGRLSANTTVIIERLSFSTLHKAILAFCITASGSSLLLCCLIYCRLQNAWEVTCLQICLNFLPNIMMFIAVILWGVSEGFLNETLACSALYLLRPNMLFRAGPYGSRALLITKWMNSGLWSFIEYIVFTGIIYSVLIEYALDRSWTIFNFHLILGGFVMMILLSPLLCLTDPGYSCDMIMPIIVILSASLMTSGLIFMFYLIAVAFCGTQAFLATGIFPLSTSMIITLCASDNSQERYTNRQSGSSWIQRASWLCAFLPFNAFMIWLYITVLKNHEERIGWLCVIVFLQIQWTHMQLTWLYYNSVYQHSAFVYVFGSVGVVLLNSLTLMTELILKIFNGERTVGDLRFFLFPSESLFTLFLLILQLFTTNETRVYKGCLIPAAIILFIVVVLVSWADTYVRIKYPVLLERDFKYLS